MAASAPGKGQHYGDVSIREDLTDIIFTVTPVETPVMNITKRGTANQIVHQWQNRDLTVRQDNAQPEGAVYDFSEANRRTVRNLNVTQNFLKQIRVSSTLEAAEQAGIASMFADQSEVRTVELKTDLEHAVIAGTLATGATGTSRRMMGLVEAIETGGIDGGTGTTHTTHSGVTLNENVLNNLIQMSWDNGGAPRDWFCGGRLKRTVSGFTQSSTAYRDQAAGRLVNTISVYESDFFVIETHLSRDVPGSGIAANSTFGLLGLDRTMLEFALLRPVTMRRTADIASSTDGVIEGEGCITWGNALGHIYADGIYPAVI